MKKYGCESPTRNSSIPKSVLRFLRKHGIKDPIIVPKRKNGLTSSGEYNECHQNVWELVKTFGGKQLQGYMVELER